MALFGSNGSDGVGRAFPFSINGSQNFSWPSFNGSWGQYSDRFLEIKHVLEAYVIPCVCALGCLGNFLSLTVLCRNRFRKTDGSSESGSHLGLIFLAASDLLFCVVLFPRALLPGTHARFPQKNFSLFYQLYGTGLVTTFILTSTWITVIMAFLRYLSICHPFLVRRWDALTCAKIVYPTTTVLCVLFNTPSFFMFTVFKTKTDDKEYYLIDIGKLDTSKTEGLVFQWFRAILGVFVPSVILALCNYALIQALRNSYRIRAQSYVKDSAQRSRKWITITLIAIAVCFILLVFPSELMDFFINLVKLDISKTETFMLARSFTNVLQVTNFSLNFILYCVINVHFRTVLLESCRCLCPYAGGESAQTGRVPRSVKRMSSSLRTSVTAL